MENRYVLQQQNSVTKKWNTILEGDLDAAEKEFEARSSNPDNQRFGHKYRVMEMSRICGN